MTVPGSLSPGNILADDNWSRRLGVTVFGSPMRRKGLLPHERVLRLDEKTSIQPRPRSAKAKPARPRCTAKVEHEYSRCRATNLLAALDTRTGHVTGLCRRRKRQAEFIELESRSCAGKGSLIEGLRE